MPVVLRESSSTSSVKPRLRQPYIEHLDILVGDPTRFSGRSATKVKQLPLGVVHFDEVRIILEPYVKKIAEDFERHLQPEYVGAVSAEDLSQEAFKEIFREYMRFDHSAPTVEFIRYSKSMVKGVMIDHLRELQSAARTINKLRKAALELSEEKKPPTPENLSAKTGLSAEHIRRNMYLLLTTMRLEGPSSISDEGDLLTLHETVASQRRRPDGSLHRDDPAIFLMDDMGAAVSGARLTPRETVIIALRTGNPKVLGALDALSKLDRDDGKAGEIGRILEMEEMMKFKEIGWLFGFSESWACQIFKGGIWKLERAHKALQWPP